MPIGIQSKLNELSRCQRTDGSIQAQYNQVQNIYKRAKMVYKSSKLEYKNAEQQLSKAEEYLWNAPLSKKLNAHKQVKIAKKNLIIGMILDLTGEIILAKNYKEYNK